MIRGLNIHTNEIQDTTITTNRKLVRAPEIRQQSLSQLRAWKGGGGGSNYYYWIINVVTLWYNRARGTAA